MSNISMPLKTRLPLKTRKIPTVFWLSALGSLVVSQAVAGSRFTMTGYAEPTAVGGARASWLRDSPGGEALLLVLVQADRHGFDRTGKVRWIVQTDGRRLPDGTLENASTNRSPSPSQSTSRRPCSTGH